MEEIASKECPHVIDGLTNIQTPHGVGKFSGIKVSELGHIMVKVFFPEEESYINYSVGNFQNLLAGANLQLSE
jgi:hypothetical protein